MNSAPPTESAPIGSNPVAAGHLRLIGVGRLMVPSEEDPESAYLVDLASYDTNGRCGCRHFETRLWPLIREARAAGTFTPSDATRCKHLIHGRRYFTHLIEHPGDYALLDEALREINRRTGGNNHHDEE